MDSDDNSLRAAGYILLLLAGILLCAGCTTITPPVNSTPVTPAVSPAALATTATSPAPAAAATTLPVIPVPTGTSSAWATANLSHGVTIHYPADWQFEELSQSGFRDYGVTTLNIGNFFSPNLTAERMATDGPNPDRSDYSSLSIDVDEGPVSDFEQYFNRATLAIQAHYTGLTITSSNSQLKIPKLNSSAVYKAYQINFDTETIRGSYIFANVGDKVYIFAFSNPSPYSEEVRDMVRSIRIDPGA